MSFFDSNPSFNGSCLLLPPFKSNANSNSANVIPYFAFCPRCRSLTWINSPSSWSKIWLIRPRDSIEIRRNWRFFSSSFLENLNFNLVVFLYLVYLQICKFRKIVVRRNCCHIIYKCITREKWSFYWSLKKKERKEGRKYSECTFYTRRMNLFHVSSLSKCKKKKRKKRINQTCFVRFPLFSMKSYIFLPYKSSLTAKYESINFHRFGGGSETINNFREKKKKKKIKLKWDIPLSATCRNLSKPRTVK